MPTKIEWAEETWNPVTGCTPVSEGCRNCYAKRMANRLRGRFGYPADDPFQVTVHEDVMDKPFGWKKPRMVFVCSMGDIFHNNTRVFHLMKILKVIKETPRHTYLFLTKRPDNMWKVFSSIANKFKSEIGMNYLPNLWLGTSIENQTAAEERIPWLLKTPAAKRFVSYEPGLGAVDLTTINGALCSWWSSYGVDCVDAGKLDWVIAGGETGPGSRPMHPDWVRSLRDQCVGAGVPFFFKSWGDWGVTSTRNVVPIQYGLTGPWVDGMKENSNPEYLIGNGSENHLVMEKVGKKRAGRILDGREWNEIPEGSEKK